MNSKAVTQEEPIFSWTFNIRRFVCNIGFARSWLWGWVDGSDHKTIYFGFVRTWDEELDLTLYTLTLLPLDICFGLAKK